MVKLVCIVEVEDAVTVEQAQEKLDAFREATQPAHEYGLTIYRASEAEADTAIYDVTIGDVEDETDNSGSTH